MNQDADPSASGAQPSAYERLGIDPSASFDVVQTAKHQRLEEVGDDPQARARIEAAYDAVLMDRLKERQQGKVSSAALNASQREAARPALASVPPQRPSLPALPALPSLPRPNLVAPTLALAEGRDRWLALGGGGLLIALSLLAPATGELLLALGTVLTAVVLQRRHGRFLAAVGWSVALLSLGLLIGGLLVHAIDPSQALPLGLPWLPQQVQSLPALLLLMLGALLIG
jgi:hypothetical protein